MRFKMTQNGVDSYTKALNNRLKFIRSQLAKKLKSQLEITSPKRTGKLASSYSIKINSNDIQIFNDCGYCRYVNDGTRYQAGQHFIQLSVAIAQDFFNQIVSQSQKISH